MLGTILAAIVYEPGEGPAADAILLELGGRLVDSGVRLAGVRQESSPREDRCACDLIVTDLRTGAVTSISEDRGPEARGCRLDSRALEALVGTTLSALEEGADLLFVNKFGKQEAEGEGFRPAVALALEREIPVLIAVNRSYLPAWREFTGGLGAELPLDRGAVAAWCEGALQRILPDAPTVKGDAAGASVA